MYRQNSVPEKMLLQRSPKSRGAHSPRQRQRDSVRRAASERLMGKNGSSNNNRWTGRGEDRDEEEAAQRAKLLEQIQFLESHLAGCMVEFLIEEVEKNVLHAYANAATVGDYTFKDNEEDDNGGLSEEEEEEEELSEVNDDSVEDFDEEEEAILSPISKPRGGIGALYGNKLGGNSLLQTQQQMGRGNINCTQRMDARGDGSASSLALGKSKSADTSPSMPSRGIRRMDNQAPVSPRRGVTLAALGGSPTRAGRASLSPPRHSVQVGTLPYNNPSTRRCPGQPFISDEDDDEEEESNFLMSSKRADTSKANGRGETNDFRRNTTLPGRLNNDSPHRAAKRTFRKSVSPTAPSRQLGLDRFEQELDGSANSLPRRPNRSVDLKPSFASDDMEDNSGSHKLASPSPTRSRLGSFETSPTRKEAAGVFESKAAADASPTSDPSRPRPTRNTKFNKFEPSPATKTPGRPGLAPARLMVKQGSVRHVMGIFESKSKGNNASRPTMPLLRENSVKNIVDALKEEEEEDNNNGESIEDESATNPNEAPDSSSKVNALVHPSRTKTPPRINRKFSKSPDGSPKRGVQRNNSGMRMQRFLENKSVERTNSGVKSFLSKKGSGSSHGSTGSAGLLAKPARVARKGSGNIKRGVDRSPSGMRRGIPRRTASGTGGKKGLVRRQFSFGKSSGTAKSSSFGMFAKDNVTNKLSHDTRKQKRIFKTQNALRKLKKAAEADITPDDTEGSESNFDDFNMEHLLGTMALPLPCGVKYDCALLFVDISGFTQLSTTLKVEKLSKTINAYFQLIVEHVESFGGDILKFAGDAVFVEWRASSTTLLEGNRDDPLGGTYGGQGLGAEKAAITAAACAARIIDKCADYKVLDENGKKVATLNLHCAIGFGEVVGVHLGNTDRMEYFIIGEPIAQVAEAMDLGKMGEVVASPACLKYLDGEQSDQPKVILSKANKLMNPKLILVKASKKSKSTLADRLEDWDIAALKSLQKSMSPYVHPVVVENQLKQKGYGSAQERFTSEAEIRDVFTVFIQPMVSAQLTGNGNEDKEVLKNLHDIMVIVNNELRRFKGQLRQYTVDDKGMALSLAVEETFARFVASNISNLFPC